MTVTGMVKCGWNLDKFQQVLKKVRDWAMQITRGEFQTKDTGNAKP